MVSLDSNVNRCKDCKSRDWILVGDLNAQNNKRIVQCKRCKRIMILKWKDTYYADFEVPTVKQITTRYGEKTIILENCKKCPLRYEDFDECCATCERLPTSLDKIPDHCKLEDYNG